MLIRLLVLLMGMLYIGCNANNKVVPTSDLEELNLVGPVKSIHELVYTNTDDSIKAVGNKEVLSIDSLSFNVQGNLLQKISIVLADKQTTKHLYTYDERARLATLRVYDNNILSSTTTMHYDANDRLIEERFFDENDKFTANTKYAYDQRGHLMAEYWYKLADASNEFKMEGSKEMKYDKKGNIVETTYKNAQGAVSSITSKAYNAEGFLIKHEERDGNGKPAFTEVFDVFAVDTFLIVNGIYSGNEAEPYRYGYKAKEVKVPNKYVNKTRFKAGNAFYIMMTYYAPNTNISYTYDEHYSLRRERGKLNGMGFEYQWDITYDAYQNAIKIIKYTEGSSITTTTERVVNYYPNNQ